MRHENSITVSIIEDNKVIRDNITKYVDYTDGIILVNASGSVETFLHNLENRPYFKSDILLLDIGLPGMSGLDAIEILVGKLPEMNIIMLTTYEDEEKILLALCSGAIAYISKKTSLAEIMEAIKIVYNGGSYMSPSIAREIVRHFSGDSKQAKQSLLTSRQLEILELLVKGLSYVIIAEKLSISPETVKSHIKKIYSNLKVNNKAGAIAKYLRDEIY